MQSRAGQGRADIRQGIGTEGLGIDLWLVLMRDRLYDRQWQSTMMSAITVLCLQAGYVYGGKYPNPSGFM